MAQARAGLCVCAGVERHVAAGRMETTMQNLAECLADSFPQPLSPEQQQQQPLSTFMVYNLRRKVRALC